MYTAKDLPQTVKLIQEIGKEANSIEWFHKNLNPNYQPVAKQPYKIVKQTLKGKNNS